MWPAGYLFSEIVNFSRCTLHGLQLGTTVSSVCANFNVCSQICYPILFSLTLTQEFFPLFYLSCFLSQEKMADNDTSTKVNKVMSKASDVTDSNNSQSINHASTKNVVSNSSRDSLKEPHITVRVNKNATIKWKLLKILRCNFYQNGIQLLKWYEIYMSWSLFHFNWALHAEI